MSAPDPEYIQSEIDKDSVVVSYRRHLAVFQGREEARLTQARDKMVADKAAIKTLKEERSKLGQQLLNKHNSVRQLKRQVKPRMRQINNLIKRIQMRSNAVRKRCLRQHQSKEKIEYWRGVNMVRIPGNI